ncbi:Spherulation-specific family 4-domain-containing protein [Massariosphaeria phaeospora]|uniref:Spherulation-specific family 4-domain-containing protein n=1 Tax=Massariosphaeria phaeospora TaxID=100035 RepID=A0A7C8MJF2_9PLEO|nr:Spherulation-specific family 4-domain-containing protein [Massariosphaeria phaeospora]
MNASVIIPLYVYPSAGAWDPVYEMVLSYPRVQFTAIVNPHSGPGEGMLPNEDYLQAIQTLNSFSNVRTIGYVATTWFKRDLSSVLQDIAVYAGWGNHDSSLAMSGVFFDEIPTGYSSELVSYLQTISKAVHNSHGLRDGYVGKSDPFISALSVLRGLHQTPKPEIGGSRSTASSLYCSASATVPRFRSW